MQKKFIIPAGTPIVALGNVYDEDSVWKEVLTKKDNVFSSSFLQEGEAADNPEQLYEGGMECGWVTAHCNTIYRYNVQQQMMCFTLNMGGEYTAIMMVAGEHVQVEQV